jgi:hypothetical protein
MMYAARVDPMRTAESLILISIISTARALFGTVVKTPTIATTDARTKGMKDSHNGVSSGTCSANEPVSHFSAQNTPVSMAADPLKRIIFSIDL